MKPKNNSRIRAIFFLLILAIAMLDQLTKNLLAADGVLCNSHGAFGIFNISTVFVFLVWLVILGIFLKEKQNAKILAFALIAGGGLANLTDRLIFGCVRDFINLSLIPWLRFLNFPSFNLADFAITCGALMLLLLVFKEKFK